MRRRSKDVPIDRGWLLVMTDMGLDPYDMLARARLPEDLFTRRTHLTVSEYFRLWGAFADGIGDDTFPVGVAESISVEAFSPMIFAALCSPDLKTAFERIAQYKRLVAPISVMVETRRDGLFVQKRWDHTGESVPATLSACDLTLLTQIARIGTRQRIEPIRVIWSQPIEPVAPYEAFFGVTPEVGVDYGLLFSPEDARRPFVTASDALWNSFEPELKRRLHSLTSDAPMAERVRSTLIETLPGGGVSIQETARKLGVSRRTLQRKLRSEGASFKEVVRQTRERLATHYLTNTDLAYAEISFLVGFAEPSSFFRAFRTWTGVTPEMMRTSHA